jgi:hypothetical protein
MSKLLHAQWILLRYIRACIYATSSAYLLLIFIALSFHIVARCSLEVPRKPTLTTPKHARSATNFD